MKLLLCVLGLALGLATGIVPALVVSIIWILYKAGAARELIRSSDHYHLTQLNVYVSSDERNERKLVSDD